MSLKFKCSNCGVEMSSETLKTGDELTCKMCSKKIKITDNNMFNSSNNDSILLKDSIYLEKLNKYSSKILTREKLFITYRSGSVFFAVIGIISLIIFPIFGILFIILFFITINSADNKVKKIIEEQSKLELAQIKGDLDQIYLSLNNLKNLGVSVLEEDIKNIKKIIISHN